MSDRFVKNQSSGMNMTTGSIPKLLLTFSLPMLLGNLFQVLYNTVDALVVGNFVGKQALAAVGSTTMAINIAVFFFNGMSMGGSVVISRHYGSGDLDRLHRAVETTMAMTFALSIVFTFAGMAAVPTVLRLMDTPDDVMESAAIYLRTYFAGISGLLVYNMGSGILRAVGDTRRPLLFLIFSSVLNTLLDLLFVVVLRAGIAGAAIATVLAQFISAALVLALLTRTRDVYRLTWRDLRPDWAILRDILSVGLPTGIQSIITSVSNVFVQSYINGFGSDCMAGWSCYNKLDNFVYLPVQSMSQAAATFVSQNIGAKQMERANRGTAVSVWLSVGITAASAVVLVALAPFFVAFFSRNTEVIRFGVLFMRMNTPFLVLNAVNHVLAGALRGRGDGTGPMVIQVAGFVVIRQIYLYTITRFIRNEYTVGISYPVGWVSCGIIMLVYYWFRHVRKKTAV